MKKIVWIKFVLFLCGLSIVTFGGRLILYANIGTSGIDAFAVGLSVGYGLSVGVWINIISICMILLGAIISKRGRVVGAILASVLVGLLFDFWGVILFEQLKPLQSEMYKGFCFLIGLIIGPFGTALYILTNVATGSMDYMMLAINKRFGLSIQNSRILLDVVFVLCALLVKGTVGKATILLMCTYGPILQIYYKGLRHILIKTKFSSMMRKE